MKKLYIFLDCQNYNASKILADKEFIKSLSTAYGIASKDRMPCIYFQKWGNELEANNIRRNSHQSDILDFIHPQNPFIIEAEYSYKLISPIGNRNIIIRHDEYLNLNTFSILDNILENSKLQIESVEVFGLIGDSNFINIKNHISKNVKITTFIENLI